MRLGGEVDDEVGRGDEALDEVGVGDRSFDELDLPLDGGEEARLPA